LTALTVAAFYGKADMITLLLSMGIDPNGYPNSSSGFHTHATPLHQAVSSGSLDAVKLLAEAGASLNARDKMYDGTPLDWAKYMHRDENFDAVVRGNFKRIAAYLEEKSKAT
jgi:ankyrin repeat protein